MKRSLSLDDLTSTNAVDGVKPTDRTGYRRVVAASALGWGLDGFGHTMFALALGAILTSLHLSIGIGGTISTVSLVASAIGGMFGGALADRYGRVRVLVWVVLGFSVTTALTVYLITAFTCTDRVCSIRRASSLEVFSPQPTLIHLNPRFTINELSNHSRISEAIAME
ncbi:MFS transporter [Paraburkholderia sp. IMGN_8]|uniref:MFS transporter n=1 Tax=Paraburkholderia sp. IMGN_8 TaxID=3136564 RepID=UPI00310183BE